MKKLAKVAVATILAASSVCAFSGCQDNAIYVTTNAYFAPFEYFDANMNIKGVDVDIMNLVGQELGRPVKFENTDFEYVLDNVAQGTKYDCGAAGITITPERQERVDFSIPYYTSVQYVIYKATDDSFTVKTATDGTECIFWSDLMDKKIGVQRDTTGHIYVGLEMEGEHVPDVAPEDEYTGALEGTTGTLTPYDDANLAVNAIGANHIDVVVVDELPAQYICARNSAYVCKALYYDAETATEEQYAIAVTKGKTDLLNAINKVLGDLGAQGVLDLVSIHLGLED